MYAKKKKRELIKTIGKIQIREKQRKKQGNSKKNRGIQTIIDECKEKVKKN